MELLFTFFSSVLEKPEEGVVSIGSIPLRDQDFP